MSKKRKFDSMDYSNPRNNNLKVARVNEIKIVKSSGSFLGNSIGNYHSTELAPHMITAIEKNDIFELQILGNNLKGNLQDLQTKGVIGEIAVRAVELGNSKAICYLHENWPAINNYSNGTGLKLVHIATIHNQLSVLNTLSQQGFDLKVLSEDGSNALHYVNTVEIAGFLLDMGVNVHHKNALGLTPLDSAKARYDSAMTNYLTPYYDADMSEWEEMSSSSEEAYPSENGGIVEKLNDLTFKDTYDVDYLGSSSN